MTWCSNEWSTVLKSYILHYINFCIQLILNSITVQLLYKYNILEVLFVFLNQWKCIDCIEWIDRFRLVMLTITILILLLIFYSINNIRPQKPYFITVHLLEMVHLFQLNKWKDIIWLNTVQYFKLSQ